MLLLDWKESSYYRISANAIHLSIYFYITDIFAFGYTKFEISEKRRWKWGKQARARRENRWSAGKGRKREMDPARIASRRKGICHFLRLPSISTSTSFADDPHESIRAIIPFGTNFANGRTLIFTMIEALGVGDRKKELRQICRTIVHIRLTLTMRITEI